MVVLIVMRVTIVDKLLGSCLPPCNFIIIDLAVLDDKPHEILDHISLALLQECLLHEFHNSHVVDHVFQVFFSVQIAAGPLEFLVRKPVLPVERPLEQPLAAATAALGGEVDHGVVPVVECEGDAVLDALFHFVSVWAQIAIFVLRAVLIFLLEVQLFEHALVEDEGLVVT